MKEKDNPHASEFDTIVETRKKITSALKEREKLTGKTRLRRYTVELLRATQFTEEMAVLESYAAAFIPEYQDLIGQELEAERNFTATYICRKQIESVRNACKEKGFMFDEPSFISSRTVLSDSEYRKQQGIISSEWQAKLDVYLEDNASFLLKSVSRSLQVILENIEVQSRLPLAKK